MSGWGLAICGALGIACGGYVGVAWDRYSRRHDDKRAEYQRRVVHPSRIERMHIIKDIWQEDLRELRKR